MKPEFAFAVETVIAEGRVSRDDIEEIKRWAETQTQLPEMCDEQIALFLLSCERDREYTKGTICAHYRLKGNAPELFDGRDLDNRRDLIHQLQVLDFIILPKKTADGCVIIYHKLRDTNYASYNMEPAMNVFFMVAEAAINQDPPPKGLVVLFDMKGVGLMHLTRVRMGNVKTFLQFVQEGIPIKLKDIHVLNVVYFIDKIMGLIKPFMKKELFKLIHFYPPTIDMEVFYKQIPKECLPKEYGGDLECVRDLHDKTVQKLKEMRGFFQAEEAQRKQRFVKNDT